MRSRRRVIILVLLITLAAVGVFAVWRHRHQQASSGTNSQLTGLSVGADIAQRPIVGVIVENSPQARPQTGLGSAGIIFETPTEGGITRYLALYQDTMPDTIGPVRSLRPYFVDWALGFDTAVAHVGGSPQALQMANDLHLKDLNQFKYGDAYYRSGQRPAPHNVYTHTTALNDLQKKLGYGQSQFAPIPRKNDQPGTNPPVTTITVNYSSAEYEAQFTYQPSSNNYGRALGGNLQIDAASHQQITVKNVVVIKMPGRSIDALGSGDAEVFYDGKHLSGRWQQQSERDRLEIVDANGNELPLNRGSTWFAVLPSNGTLTF